MSGEDADDEGYVGHSFLDLSPLRRTQSAHINDSNTKELPPVPTPVVQGFSRSGSSPTVNYIKRISLFVFLELGFIILATVSLPKPIFLGSTGNFDEVKGVFTVLFILWQAAAIFPLQHVILCIFSHEWSTQWSRTETPLQDTGRIDQVSILTATIIERTRYLLRGESSNSFKLAFATSLALMSLAALGPGSVGVAVIRRDSQMDIDIGMLGLVREGDDGSTSLALQRAQMVSYLEQLGNSPYGFDVGSNNFVGWPSKDFKNGGMEVSYPSDVAKFNFRCKWEAPSLTGERNIIEAGGEKWVLESDVMQASGDGGIIPITPPNDTPLSAYLFYGSNDTYKATNGSRYTFDLGDIPALFNLSGIRNPQLQLQFGSPLLSVLVCDPQLQITGGRVRLHTNGTLSVETSGLPPVGNIPQPAANFVFARGLVVATRPTDIAAQLSSVLASAISSRIFLKEPNLANLSVVNSPLNLEDIGKNLDGFLLSASKAFTDGYSPRGDNPSTNTFATVPVQGIIQEDVMALTAAEALLIITIILSLFVVIMSTALCINAPVSLQLFNLEMIYQKLAKSRRPPAPA